MRRLRRCLQTLAEIAAERLLRLKGIVNFAGENRPTAIHAVQHSIYPFASLPAWPDDDHRNRLVVITRDLDENSVLRLLNPQIGHGWSVA